MNPLRIKLTVGSYMSKAPDAAADYNGSGPWFKIEDWGKIWVPAPLRYVLTRCYRRPKREQLDLEE